MHLTMQLNTTGKSKAVELVREVLDQSAVDKLKTIPQSGDTISRQIEEMSNDIKQQTTARIKAMTKDYVLQMDKSIDITDHAMSRPWA